MSMELKVGKSDKSRSLEAGREAAEKVVSEDLKLVYVFASTDHELPELLEGVEEKVGDVPVVGCSSKVEVGTYGFSRGTAVVGGFSGDIDVGVGIGKNLEKDSYSAGKKAIKDAFDDLESEEVTPYTKRKDDGWKNSRDLFVNIFADPLKGSGRKMLDGINDFMGPGFSTTGEFAADDMEFKKTFVFHDGEVYEGSVVCTVVKTGSRVGAGSAHGFRPTPNEYRVTESEGARVKKIGGKTPKEVYGDIFGEEKAEDPGFLLMAPFGMKEEGEDEYTIRVTLDIDDEGGYVCGAEVPQHRKVHLMMGEKKSLLEASKKAAENALDNAGLEKGDVEACILFSCVGRDAIYNDEKLTDEEIENVRETLGKDTQIVGLYGFGQIAPKKGFADFKEETLSLQIIGK